MNATEQTPEQFRWEHDSLGEIEVPKEALYGAQTQRAMTNFQITGRRMHTQMIRSIGKVKKASAYCNNQCGFLDDERLKYITEACDEVIAGKLDQWFITDCIQGGAGTSFNMNANEVIANRAAQLAGREIGVYDYIHPNDHINFGQSTNDVFPTAGRLTALALVEVLLGELTELQHSLLKKAKEFDGVIKMGRTHLQDAVPIRLGQEFHAYATMVGRDIKRIRVAFNDLKAVNMGATAVGTGLNADEKYKKMIVPVLSEISGITLSSAKDLVDGTRNCDTLAFASGALKVLAVNLSKMCNDLRMMASGPKAGLAEIKLPDRQPGSSIMPGKVNPVIAEVCNQACFNVIGNDVTIAKAAEAGQLELNVFEPVLFKNLFESIEIMANACHTLRINAIDGIKANKENCLFFVERSVSPITAFAPHIGYANASRIAKQALIENRTLREVLLESGLITEHDLEIIMDVQEMTKPGIPGKKRLAKNKKKEKVEG